MWLNSYRGWLLALALVLLAARVPAGTTNSVADAVGDAHDELLTASLLQIQEQLHNTQLAIQENQQVAAALARNNSDLMAAHLQSLEQSLVAERNGEAEAAHNTLEWTLLLTGAIGLAGLGMLLWMVSMQSRAFAQLAKISAQQNAVFSNLGAIRELAAPARATVADTSARLLEVVGELKERVSELESGGRAMTPVSLGNGATQDPGKSNGHGSVPASAHGGPHGNGNGNGNANGNGGAKAKADLLAEGQKYLDEDAPRQALELFDRYLAGHPDDTDALLKKADALQKIGRHDEALAHYNRVIATDSTLAVAHLQKGGLLNRLRRYDEALNCYEQALQAQEKRRR